MDGMFEDRNNPKFSKLAYLMASEEDRVLTSIVEKISQDTGLQPICLIFDGAIISNNEETREALASSVAECELAFNVKISFNW